MLLHNMNKTFIRALLLGSVVASLSGCSYVEINKLEDPNFPALPSVLTNATKQQLDYLATGTFSDMRTNVDGIVWYHQLTGAIGREVYVLAGSDSRYATNLLGIGTAGFDNNNFLSGRYFITYSSARRTARILAQSTANTSLVTDQQKKGYSALAKTAEAYAMIVLSDLQYENGLRVDVADPQKPGKIRSYDDVLAAIKVLLDDGAKDLAASGTALPFPLPSGYVASDVNSLNFSTPAGFLKFNRALAARLAIRRASRPSGSYQEVLDALSGSFVNDAGPLTDGPRFTYGGTSPDVVNPLFQKPNFTGSVVTVAHPSFRRDIRATDTRINKIAARTAALPPRQGFSSADDVVLYATNTSPIPIIKKEELVLLSAEAHAMPGPQQNLALAVTEVNSVATAYAALRPTPLTATSPSADILDEILYQRRYSLFFEGQRWVDLRRLNQLNRLNVPGTSLPEISSTNLQTTIVRQLPIPFAEVSWDIANP